MSFPRILERDTRIIDWRTHLAAFCTSTTWWEAQAKKVRSDGLLHTDYATLDVEDDQGIAAGLVRCVGVHLTGPEPGDEFTPYAINVSARAEHAEVSPFLFVGESPATITSNAAGDDVLDTRHILQASHQGTGGGALDGNIFIVANENTADRGICFGVGMMSPVGSSALGLQVSMSVRRLVGVEPPIYDSRKL